MTDKTLIRVGPFEVAVITAVHALGPSKSYGTQVWEKVEEIEGRRVSSGALYTTLHRLRDKGVLEAKSSSPTRVRGGKAKVFYSLTAKGHKYLDVYSEGVRGVLGHLAGVTA